MAQPAWELTQTQYRPGCSSGMRTASTASPLSSSNRNWREGVTRRRRETGEKRVASRWMDGWWMVPASSRRRAARLDEGVHPGGGAGEQLQPGHRHGRPHGGQRCVGAPIQPGGQRLAPAVHSAQHLSRLRQRAVAGSGVREALRGEALQRQQQRRHGAERCAEAAGRQAAVWLARGSRGARSRGISPCSKARQQRE